MLVNYLGTIVDAYFVHAYMNSVVLKTLALVSGGVRRGLTKHFNHFFHVFLPIDI